MRTISEMLHRGNADREQPCTGRSLIIRRRPKVWRLAALASATAMIATFAASVPASAGGRHPGGGADGVIAQGLAGPLSIDTDHRGSVLVAQQFSGTVSRVSGNGTVTDLFNVPGLDAVANGPFGSVIYSMTSGEDSPGPVEASLQVRAPNGKTRQLADLGKFEATHNPDGNVTYGVAGLTDECASQWPADELGPPQYNGDVNANPYSMAVTPWGVYVADAGANDLLFVTWWGSIHLVTVFSPQALRITPGFAAANGIPDCAVGLTYKTNAVPTDIEVTPRGAYVSLLPGGPEDPSAGARGVVLKVNLWNGRTRTVGSGFLGATDLAVSPRGEVYVTELFGGRVSKLTPNGPVAVAELDTPVAVEWQNNHLYVASGAFGNGMLSRIRA